MTPDPLRYHRRAYTPEELAELLRQSEHYNATSWIVERSQEPIELLPGVVWRGAELRD